MNISIELKKRFCKDCNIPINIFQEPYFSERMELYDPFYNTLDKWHLFVSELNKYNTEQDYFEHYNRVKDAAINCIKNSEAYQIFNNDDMSKYYITNTNISGKDIFHPSNHGKRFISIDMKKANFSALQHYGDCMFKSMFAGASTWEDFVGLFTDNKHIINSKYIRQAICGNCNPGRHITYEKHLMDLVLTDLTERYFSINKIVSFTNDEIVIDISNMNESSINLFKCAFDQYLQQIYIPFTVEDFMLRKIDGTKGYYKYFRNANVEFKCLDSLYLPFVIRKMLGEDITENDKVFYHEGLLAKFIEAPEIQL